MTIVERIKKMIANPPLNEDGEPYGTKLLPPFTPEEILSVEREIGHSLPEETRRLLGFCGGFENGPMETVNFRGSDCDYIVFKLLKGVFQEISPDGFGNFWFYWRQAGHVDLGPIYFYEHEGPMLFYQCATIVEFTDECLRFMTPPYASLLDDVHECRLRPVKDLYKDLKNYEAATKAGDEQLRSFAKPFDPSTVFL